MKKIHTWKKTIRSAQLVRRAQELILEDKYHEESLLVIMSTIVYLDENRQKDRRARQHISLHEPFRTKLALLNIGLLCVERNRDDDILVDHN